MRTAKSAITNETLFPTNVAGRDWQEFPADGFSDPAVGVVYRGGQVRPGMPLG